jgi:glycerol-3-phosphate dehydrogenase (NAD(P)+)
MERIAVLGAGVMGTAIASHLNNLKHQVNLWGTDLDEEVIKTRRQKRLNVELVETINVFYQHDIQGALRGTKLVVLCVKAAAVDTVFKYVSTYLRAGMVILNIAKGIPDPPHLTLSDSINSRLPRSLLGNISLVAMGGPARAEEIVRGTITEVVLASSDTEAASFCCRILHGPTFITTSSTDFVGVELCAAMKNSFAILLGIGEGIQRGDNLKAALMARSIEEMAKIVIAVGGKMETVLGPAGVGDLYLTAAGGRNRTLGKLVGEGIPVKRALEKMRKQTVEGYTTLRGIHRIVTELEREKKLNIKTDLLLFHNLYRTFYENTPVQMILKNYVNRKELGKEEGNRIS